MRDCEITIDTTRDFLSWQISKSDIPGSSATNSHLRYRCPHPLWAESQTLQRSAEENKPSSSPPEAVLGNGENAGVGMRKQQSRDVSEKQKTVQEVKVRDKHSDERKNNYIKEPFKNVILDQCLGFNTTINSHFLF